MDLARWHMWWKRSGAHELRALLMEAWDPIGVAGIPEAADEYDSYIGPVARLLREDRRVGEIASYLHHVRTSVMGLDGSPEMDERDREVATRLVAWYEDVARA